MIFFLAKTGDESETGDAPDSLCWWISDTTLLRQFIWCFCTSTNPRVNTYLLLLKQFMMILQRRRELLPSELAAQQVLL